MAWGDPQKPAQRVDHSKSPIYARIVLNLVAGFKGFVPKPVDLGTKYRPAQPSPPVVAARRFPLAHSILMRERIAQTESDSPTRTPQSAAQHGMVEAAGRLWWRTLRCRSQSLCRGAACAASSPRSAFVTPIRSSAYALSPKVGAGCVRSARAEPTAGAACLAPSSAPHSDSR